jgi:flagellar biosynthesis anti-sigma factor FlgM
MASIDPKLNTANLNPASTSGSAGTNGSAGTSGSVGTGAKGRTAQLDPVKVNSSSVASNRASERTDEVQLSSLSSKINELQSGSPEREAYLDGLRLQVASGQYQVNPAEVASEIVADALRKSE